MGRFDVHSGRDGQFYLDVQADRLSQLNTRVVIPLMPKESAPVPARRLNPFFELNGRDYMLATQYLAAISVTALGPIQVSLKSQADKITDALDVLLLGF